MACATCSGTVQMVFSYNGHKVWWCPRCGTVKDDHVGHETVHVPALVERCREFEKTLHIDGSADARIARWHQLGIAESINLSESRPT